MASKTVSGKISRLSTYALLGKITAASTSPPTSNTTVLQSPASNATTPSGKSTASSDTAVNPGMAIPVLVIIVIGGLLIIGFGIAFAFKRNP